MSRAYLLLLIPILSCSAAIPLSNPDPRIDEYSQKIVASCFFGSESGADITSTLNDFKTLLDEIFQGQPLPQASSKKLKLIYDPGYSLSSYPPEEKLPGAIVGRPIPVGIYDLEEAELWPDQVAVFGSDRFISFDREYEEGTPDKFLSAEIDSLTFTNHVVDVGDEGISFKYDTSNVMTRHRGDSLPAEGAVVLCSQMNGEAQRVAGGFNAYMKKLHSFTLYYPVDGSHTYRIVASWVKAGGGLSIFSATANSGNIGQSLVLEFENLTDWVESH